MERSLVDVRQWRGMRSEYSWLPPHEAETVTAPGRVGVAFSSHSDVAYEVDRRSGRATYPGGSVIVSGEAPIVWTEVRETTEAVEISLEGELLARLADGPSGAGGPLGETVVGIADPVVLGVASVLRRLHVTGSDLSDVGADCLAHMLARHVLSRYSGVAVAAGRGPTRLSWRDVATVHDLVDAELGTVLTLARLARAVHLSPFHFARAFRATVGMTPHAFVTSRRIDRARLLLVGSEAPVSEIAWRVGFTNLSHFRRVFRAHNGVLPGELRAATVSPPPHAGGRARQASGRRSRT